METKKNIYVEKIKIKDLSLWNKSFRLADSFSNKSQKELIEYYCLEKRLKIKYLAKEIVREFDFPQIERLVVLNKNNQLNVVEGNRRLVVYKLLSKPDLAPNEEIKIFFQDLKAENNITINNNFLLECIISSNFKYILSYVEKKHLNKKIS